MADEFADNRYWLIIGAPLHVTPST